MHHDTALNWIHFLPHAISPISEQNRSLRIQLDTKLRLHSKAVFHSAPVWTVAESGNHVANVKWNNNSTQIVLPWGFGFYLFTSCTLYHLNQPPEDYYYVLLIFWVLNLKKCWKLIASVRIKEDFCLEQIKCCVIKNPLNYQAQCMTAIESRISKHILCLLFSTSVSHLKYCLHNENWGL